MTEEINITDDSNTSDFTCGFNFGWQLSEDIQEKRLSNTMTQDDVLTLGNMFKEFYEKAEKNKATPYETGFLDGVTEFGKTVDTKTATTSGSK